MRLREGIQFVVYLAGLNVKKLAASGRPGDVPNLCHDLCRFAQAPSFRERLELAKPSVLDDYLEPLRRLVCAVADQERFENELKAGTRLQFDRRATTGDVSPFVIRSPAFDQALVITGAFYLARFETDRIRRCPEADCRKIFLALPTKSKRFCSHECASRASIRAYHGRQIDTMRGQVNEQKARTE